MFAAAPSAGWAWLIGIALSCFAFAAVLVTAGVASGSSPGAIFTVASAVVLVILGMLALALSGWSRAVRYEVYADKVVMRCGGPVQYRIPLAEVKKISRQDLTMTAWSSTRFPGFALGSVPYAGIGHVIMCSTRSLKGILLIETGSRKYGLTPADEQAFLSEVRRQMEARRCRASTGRQWS